MSSEEETGEHRERSKRDRSEECEDDVSKKAKVAERPDDNQNPNNNPNLNPNPKVFLRMIISTTWLWKRHQSATHLQVFSPCLQ